MDRVSITPYRRRSTRLSLGVEPSPAAGYANTPISATADYSSFRNQRTPGAGTNQRIGEGNSISSLPTSPTFLSSTTPGSHIGTNVTTGIKNILNAKPSRPSEVLNYASAASVPTLALPSRPNAGYLDWIRDVVFWRRITGFVLTAPALTFFFVVCRWIVEYFQIKASLIPLTKKLLTRTIVSDPLNIRNLYTWPLGLLAVVPVFFTLLLVVSPWLGSIASRSANSLYITSDDDIEGDDIDMDDFESEEEILAALGLSIPVVPTQGPLREKTKDTSGESTQVPKSVSTRKPRRNICIRFLKSLRKAISVGSDSNTLPRIFALVAIICSAVIVNISFGFSSSHYVLALQSDGSVDVALPTSFLETSTFASFLRSAPKTFVDSSSFSSLSDTSYPEDTWSASATSGESEMDHDNVVMTGKGGITHAPESNKSYGIRRRTKGLMGALLALMPSDRWLVNRFTQKPYSTTKQNGGEEKFVNPEPLDLAFLFSSIHAIIVAFVLWLSPAGSNRATSPVPSALHAAKSRFAHIFDALPRLAKRAFNASLRVLLLSILIFTCFTLVVSSTRAAQVRRDLRVALESEGPNLDALVFGMGNAESAGNDQLAAVSAAALGIPQHHRNSILARLRDTRAPLEEKNVLKSTSDRSTSSNISRWTKEDGIWNTLSMYASRVWIFIRKGFRRIGVPQLLVGSDADDVYFEYIRSRIAQYGKDSFLTAPPLVVADPTYDQAIPDSTKSSSEWVYRFNSPVLATSHSLASGQTAVLTYLKDGIIYTIDKQVLPPPKMWMLILLATLRAYIVAFFFIVALLFQREVLQLILREPLSFDGYILHGLAHVEAPLARLLAYLDLLRIIETDPSRTMRLIADGLPVKYAPTPTTLSLERNHFTQQRELRSINVLTTLPTSLDVPFIYDNDSLPDSTVSLAPNQKVASLGQKQGLGLSSSVLNGAQSRGMISTLTGNRLTSADSAKQFVLHAYDGPIPTLAAVHAATIHYLVSLYTKRLYTHLIHDLKREAKAPKTVRQMIASSMFGGLLRIGTAENNSKTGIEPTMEVQPMSTAERLFESVVSLPAPPANQRRPIMSLIPLMFAALLRTLIILTEPFGGNSASTLMASIKRFVIIPIAHTVPGVLVAMMCFEPLHSIQRLVNWLVCSQDGETDESAVDMELLNVALHSYTSLISQSRFVPNSAAPGFASLHLLPSALSALAELSAVLDIYVSRGLLRARAIRIWQLHLSSAASASVSVSAAAAGSSAGSLDSNAVGTSSATERNDVEFTSHRSGLLTAAELMAAPNSSVLATAAGFSSVEELNRSWLEGSPYAMTSKFCFTAETDVSRAFCRLANMFHPLLKNFVFAPDVASRINALLNN